MFKTQTVAKRTNVTVDDRRAVIVQARGRKPKDVATMPHEAFIRNALKDRLGWPRRDPAPQAVLDAAKQMAAAVKAEEKTRFEAAQKKAAEVAALREKDIAENAE